MPLIYSIQPRLNGDCTLNTGGRDLLRYQVDIVTPTLWHRFTGQWCPVTVR